MKYISPVADSLIFFGLLGEIYSVIYSVNTDSLLVATLFVVVSSTVFMIGLNLAIKDVVDDRIRKLEKEIEEIKDNQDNWGLVRTVVTARQNNFIWQEKRSFSIIQQYITNRADPPHKSKSNKQVKTCFDTSGVGLKRSTPKGKTIIRKSYCSPTLGVSVQVFLQ